MSYINAEEKEYLISGNFLQILGMILLILTFTQAIDSSYQSLKVIKRRIQDQLIICQDTVKWTEFYGLLLKINDLGPMNACGYFEIDKSTLTSMLSVRYLMVFKRVFLFMIHFSVTYIIILAQFKLSESSTEVSGAHSFINFTDLGNNTELNSSSV